MMNITDSKRPNPFPGLRPFRSDEHHLFFGREEQTAALLQLLRTNRFLAVVGTSGSGKSSLVRAGMIAELHGGTMTQAGSTWEVMVLRPGCSPIENLARAFVDTDLYDGKDASTLPRLLATLNRSRYGLVEAMKQCELFEPGTNLLVVVDQFEELFRFRQQGVDSEETAAAFVNLLLTASEQAECPIYLTITMRSDYLGDCSEIPGLAEAVNKGEYLIPRLMRDQKRDAIEKPIGVGGAKISPLLVQRLLNEVGDDPDQLPVLQHALMRMWDVWTANSDHNRPIDFGDFEATGGLGAALSNHADEIYDSLPDDRCRSVCEKIFKSLTVKGDDNRGIRRPTRLAHLQAIANANREMVTTVLNAFRGSGVTFVMPGTEVELDGRTVLDLSHESLMRGWQRLRGWVEEEAQSARVFRRLLDTARLWSDGKAGLFRDPDLQIALSWREQEAPNAEWAEQYGGQFEKAIRFLEASNAEAEAERQTKEAARQRELEQAQELAESRKQRLMQQQRAAKRLRKLIAGLAVVALIAGLACIAALMSRNEAGRLARVAEQEADHARQNEEKATQNAQRAERSQTETADALRLAQAAEEAGRKLLYTTDMQLAPFLWRDGRTTAEQLRTLLSKHIPDQRMTDTGGKDESGRIKDGKRSDSAFNLQPSSFQKPDLRGFEWYYYQHLLENSATVLSGHGAPITDSVFGSNGDVVTLDQSGQIRRWDLNSHEEDKSSRRDLTGGTNAQVRVLSPNGQRAALAQGNKVHIFDTTTGKETIQLDSANRFDRRLIFSRDESMLVIVDNKIRWCNALSGEVTASVDQTFGGVLSLALSADGLTLAQVGSLGFLILRLDPTTRTVTTLAKDLTAEGEALSVSALSPDGRRIAVGCRLAGLLFVFDTATGGSIAKYGSAHASPILAIAFSGDGMKLATADAQGTIKIWTDAQKLTSKSTALWTLKGHQAAITAISFSIDGKRLVSGSADKTVRLWDLANAGAAIRPLQHSSDDCWVARLSSDGQLIAAADGSRVRLWDAATGQLVRVLSAGDNSRVFSVAFSPTDSNLLATGHGGRANVSHVSLWDIHAGTEIARLPGATDLPGFQVTDGTGPVGALAFSPEGKYLVAGFGNKWFLSGERSPTPLKVWEVARRRLVRRLNGHTGYCISLDFSRDGKLLASGSRDSTAIIWSTATWKPMHSLLNPDPAKPRLTQMVDDVAFSPDGKMLALASRGGDVQLWDVATGKLLESLQGHSNAVQAVVFSPDGRTLASGGSDQTVRLWNVATRRELMQLDPGSVALGNVTTLAFSRDGKQLLTGGEHAGAAIWSAAPIVWNDPDWAAERLRMLLGSNADFQTRIRMLSENLWLHEGLAKLDTKDVRVRAAQAATQANWHASRQAWPAAVKAFDRLVAADPTNPDGWLRTPGLLRLATALLHQDRPRDAAALLKGGAKRRASDGLPDAVDQVAVGVIHSAVDGTIQVTELLPDSPAARSRLRPGDIIVKVNDTELTTESLDKFVQLLEGEPGTKVRLTVRHSGSERPEVMELTRERFVQDRATGELLQPLRAAINERLAKEPHNPALLELRAELAGQWSDAKAQVADYTAAIDALSQQKAEAKAADLKRLYGRRGNAYVALMQWHEAVDDYARAVTDSTTDDGLLSNQALARAELLLSSKRWTALKPVEAKSELGATLTILPDDSILASGANPLNDRYCVVLTIPKDIDLAAVRLEALGHPSLPGNGPGRRLGSFAQTSWKVTALRDRKDPITLQFDSAWTDHQKREFPITSQGHWNIGGVGEGQNCTAIWSRSKPVSLAAGTMLTFQMQFKEWNGVGENLGRFRLSLSRNSAAIEQEPKLLAVTNLTDPWQTLAAAYQLNGDQRAINQLVERRPKLAGFIGDLFTQEPNQNWRRAVEIYSKGLTAEATDVDLISKRARAYEAIKNWDAAVADWFRAATGNPDGAKLLAAFARRLTAGNQVALAKAQFEKSQALYEQALKGDPGNEVVAAELAQLLLDKFVSRPGALRGQFVQLDLPGENSQFPRHPGDKDKKTINLAELQVFRGGQNIALRKKVRQSSTVYAPENAVDGNTLGEDNVAPYAHTGWESDPWWEVDLGSEQPIDRIVIWNRSNANLYARMNHFRIRVLDHSRKVVLEQVVNKAPSPSTEIIPHLPPVEVADVEARLAAGYAANGRNEEAAVHFGTALRQADGYEARKPIAELAVQFDDVIAALIQRQPGDAQLQLAMARTLAERGKQLLADKHPAKAQAELEKSREVYTRFRAKHPEPRWTVLTPTEIRSKAGTTLTLQSDGSILASGASPEQETYTVVANPGLATVTAVRLEMLPHPSLPKGGSGRDSNGSFWLNEFTVSMARPGAPPAQDPLPLKIPRAVASFHRTNCPIELAIDGQLSTRWDAWPEVYRRQEAVFELQAKPENRIASTLVFQLTSIGDAEWQDNLGCFRLSATSDAHALVLPEHRMDFKVSEVMDLCVALAKSHAQQGHHNEAAASFIEALDVATDRAAKAKIIAEGAPLTGVLEKLSERAAGDGQFQAELARYFAERGDAPLAETARAKARVLFEEKLAQEPENSGLAAELAQLLLDKLENENSTRWTVLKPSAMSSKGGATLSKLPDDSILASGKNTLGDAYTIVADTKVAQVSAIRLEALTHESLPNQGPGRSERSPGNFTMDRFTIMAHVKGTQPRLIELSRVAADHFLFGLSAGYWNMGDPSRPHTAFYLAKQPGDCKDETRLEFQMQFSANAVWPLENLGRFRLSVASDPAAFDREQDRFAVLRLNDPWAKLAAAYQAIGDQRALDKVLEHHPMAIAGIGDLYAARDDWKRALVEYNKAISKGSTDASVFAARAEIHEKLEHWELAAADWGNADLHAVDKRARFGNPSFTALERRSQFLERLQQYEKVVADCNEMLKPERLGDSPWVYRLRGDAYDQLRQWQKAQADHDQAFKLSSPEERGAFHYFRGRHFAAQGQWKQAAEDMRQAYPSPADFMTGSWPRTEWWAARDAALIFGVAGNVDNYGQAAAECYGKQSAGSPNPEDSKWTVLTMLLFPDMITNENRPRLLELVGKTDGYWQPRLSAAIQFRSGDYKKAAQLFDANGGGAQFFFLAAMTHHKLGNQDRAKQLIKEGNAWIQEQRAKDPEAGVPRPNSWQDWAFVVTLQYEASELIVGPVVGPDKLPERPVGEAQFQAALARHFAARGNAPAAAAAAAKACALLPEKLAKEPENTALAEDLFSAYQVASRTREGIPYLAKASAANPKDTLLSLKVAALQAWFGQDKELTDTRHWILAFAKDTNDASTADRAAKACSIRESTNKAELEEALVLGRKGAQLARYDWTLLALGMAEYRCGNYVTAVDALHAAKASSNNPIVTGISTFYHAMSLFRQGKPNEARKLAIAAAAEMKPLPKDELNPFASGGYCDDLILWLAYKEAKAMIQFDAATPKPQAKTEPVDWPDK